MADNMMKSGNMAAAGLCCLMMLGWQITAGAEEPDYREASWQYVQWQEHGAGHADRQAVRCWETSPGASGDAGAAGIGKLENLVTRVIVDFDARENPSQATVTVEEDGFLDDDLPVVRHVVRLQRDQTEVWGFTGYRRGRSTREHLGLAGHPLLRQAL